MKKYYRIIILLIILVFITTYNPTQFDFVTQNNSTFFRIQNIEIVNNFLIEEEEIEEKLQKIYNRNIFLVSGNDIEKPLKEVNYLNKVEVKKKYPNTIVVKIFETKPIAILFKNKTKYILDSSSNLISFKSDFNKLPNIFGEKAEDHFIFFFKQLEKNNFPNDKIKNFYYFQIGRWDLQLTNSKIIKYPSNNTEEAIKKSIKLLKRKDFENYNIIDLRIEGKIIVE